MLCTKLVVVSMMAARAIASGPPAAMSMVAAQSQPLRPAQIAMRAVSVMVGIGARIAQERCSPSPAHRLHHLRRRRLLRSGNSFGPMNSTHVPMVGRTLRIGDMNTVIVAIMSNNGTRKITPLVSMGLS